MAPGRRLLKKISSTAGFCIAPGTSEDTGTDSAGDNEQDQMNKFTTPSKTPMGPPKSSSKPPATPRYKLRRNNCETDPVLVYCRLKPVEPGEQKCVKIIDSNTLALTPPENSTAWKNGQSKEGHYKFEGIFKEETPQKKIFNDVALPLVKDLLLGKNALLFAYGITGSGKTYTMSGTAQDIGIMPRCLDVIFNSISKQKALKYMFKPDFMNGFDVQPRSSAMHDMQRDIYQKEKEKMCRTPGRPISSSCSNLNRRNVNAPTVSDAPTELHFMARTRDDTVCPVGAQNSLYSVFVTYVEVYNNSVYDLLEECPFEQDARRPKNRDAKMLREDALHRVYVNTCTEIEVANPEEAFEVFARGQRRKKIAHTALNTESSRSHSIFNIRLVQAPLDEEGDELETKHNPVVSQLSLVDLAGSERYTRTGATGDRLKEAGNINASLMILRKCMEVLRENQTSSYKTVVPYRESRITYFLKNFFEGEGRVRMILCLNPRSLDYDENAHVVTFAELTKEVQVSRPQEKKPEYVPNRKRPNPMDVYRNGKKQLIAEKKLLEEGFPAVVPNLPNIQIAGMGPALPVFDPSRNNYIEQLDALKLALEKRLKSREELSKFVMDKQNAFFFRLAAIEREMQSLRQENSAVKYTLDRVKDEKLQVESSLITLQAENDKIQMETQDKDKEIECLRDQVKDTQMQLKQKELLFLKEKDRMRVDMDLQRELDQCRNERNLRSKKAELKAEYKSKDKVLKAVREAVINIDGPKTRRSHSLSMSTTATTSSDSDLPTMIDMETRRSKRVRSVPYLKDAGINEPEVTTRKSTTVISNPRFSRAASVEKETWVEHKPGNSMITDLPTVFQPKMKKKRSVTKLTKAEEMKNTAKYCLTTQEQNSEGEIENVLYKADVHPTISGGAQVTFNDVEILKQVSPLKRHSPRKRSSPPSKENRERKRSKSTILSNDPSDEAHQQLAEKCSTGIAHYSNKNPNME